MSFLKNLGATKLGLEFVTRLLGLCFVMVACMHLLGCIWLHMGLASIEAVAAADEILQNESLSAGVEVDAEMLNRNWMLREYGSLQAAESVDNWGRYVDAAYWTVVTVSSVGYGDIIPTSPSERLYVIIVIILGIFLYAYIVGSFTNMLSNVRWLAVPHTFCICSQSGIAALRYRWDKTNRTSIAKCVRSCSL